jgi:predicted metal-dependent RNase
MGDQDPSNGQWDWQSYSVTKTIPEAVNVVQVGFIHQAGEGAVEARNPSLVLVECLD